jgi:hypothetical protein
MKLICQIRVANNYGIETFYPVDENAKLFARIAGTITLTRVTLELIDQLGYEIEIKEKTYKTFKQLTAANA